MQQEQNFTRKKKKHWLSERKMLWIIMILLFISIISNNGASKKEHANESISGTSYDSARSIGENKTQSYLSKEKKKEIMAYMCDQIDPWIRDVNISEKELEEKKNDTYKAAKEKFDVKDDDIKSIINDVKLVHEYYACANEGKQEKKETKEDITKNTEETKEDITKNTKEIKEDNTEETKDNNTEKTKESKSAKVKKNENITNENKTASLAINNKKIINNKTSQKKNKSVKKNKVTNYSSNNNSSNESGYVYVTRTGSKYHQGWCRYLRKSKIKMRLSDALSSGYDACSVCY